MYKSNVSLNDGVLELKAERTSKNEGKSKSSPHLEIKYKSGAIHAKHKIVVNKAYPEYEITGEFKAPTSSGTWPAFWLTAVDGWPPETDILEFKGDDVNWQNTFLTPQNVTTIKKKIPDASKEWHTYTAKLKRVDNTHTTITYFIDGKQTGVHYTDFTDKPLWLIINLQMEGSSGNANGLEQASYFSKNVTIKRISAK